MKNCRKIIALTSLMFFNQLATAQWNKKHIAIGIGTIAAATLAVGARWAWNYFRDPITVGNAAEHGNLWTLRTSIFLNAPLNTPTKLSSHFSATGDDPVPPAHKAALNGQTAALTMLLKHGAEANQAVNGNYLYNVTPLQLAIRAKKSECVRVLLQHRADVENAGNISLLPMPENYLKAGAQAPLDRAIRQEDFDMAKLLIEHGALVKPGHLHIAAELDNKQLFDFLLSKISDRTLLNEALRFICQNSRVEYAAALIDKGAHINGTPLFCPLEEGVRNLNMPTIQLLIDRGAYTKAPVILKSFQYGGMSEDSKIPQMLLEAGMDIDAQDDKGRTSLIYLAGYNDIQTQAVRFKMIKLLIFLKANHTLCARNLNGSLYTALQAFEKTAYVNSHLSDKENRIHKDYQNCLECLKNPHNINQYLTEEEKNEFCEILKKRTEALEKRHKQNIKAIQGGLAWPGYTDQSNGPLKITAEYLGAELIK